MGLRSGGLCIQALHWMSRIQHLVLYECVTRNTSDIYFSSFLQWCAKQMSEMVKYMYVLHRKQDGNGLPVLFINLSFVDIFE